MEEKEYLLEYYEKVCGLFRTILDEEYEKISRAADLIADTIDRNAMIHIAGTGGHSFMAAEEMFYRTGGLVPVNPIFEQGLTVVHGALRSTMIERIPGYMIPVLDYYGIKQGDLLIVVNGYGMNCATIDAAIDGKRRGAKVVGVSSIDFAEHVPLDHPARHPSKKNLHTLDEVDIHIDCKMPYGDAVISFEEMIQKVGPVSSMVNFFVINQLVIAAVSNMISRGMKPPVWTSMNVPEGAQRNKQYFDEFFHRIKHL